MTVALAADKVEAGYEALFQSRRDAVLIPSHLRVCLFVRAALALVLFSFHALCSFSSFAHPSIGLGQSEEAMQILAYSVHSLSLADAV